MYRPISGTSFIAPLPLITVSPDGVPLYSSSGPTDELPTNAKRDEPEVEYIWTDQAKFIQPLLFKRGFMGEGSIANGIGYAIKISKCFIWLSFISHLIIDVYDMCGVINLSSILSRNNHPENFRVSELARPLWISCRLYLDIFQDGKKFLRRNHQRNHCGLQSPDVSSCPSRKWRDLCSI